jgi:Zn-dependent peptidase ImmA (M78 family)/DNA-binding XRE family transcriptional regulator
MSILEKINPVQLGQRLQAARNAANISQANAAKSINLSRPTLIAIENGKRRIKLDELNKLVQLYDVPLNTLLRPNVVNVNIELQFRQQKSEHSQDEIQTHKIFQKLIAGYIELEQKLNKSLQTYYPPEISIIDNKQIPQQAEDLALAVRNNLGLGLSPIVNIMTLIESELKIRLFIHPLPSKISGAFAYNEKIGACMIINKKHAKYRQAMSAAHELAHFYTSRQHSQISYDVPDEKYQPSTERFADKFAAAFLMPASAIRRHFQETLQDNNGFSPRSLIFLANRFHVSLPAMALRLEDLELLPKGTYTLLKQRGLSARLAQDVLGSQYQQDSHSLSIPRYLYLGVEAYEKDLISEGLFAELFDLDRLDVREILDELVDDELGELLNVG